jgi:PTH1 family peptidyl-tRNA hydrolase
VESCGGGDFCRLRLGIGRPRSGEPQRHVLSEFAADESTQLEDVIERATTALVDLVERGAPAAMNLHNRSS